MTAPKTTPPAPTPWHGPRGEVLVGLQFALIGLFIFLPAWQPPPLASWLAPSEWLRWAVLGLLGGIALIFAGFGALHIRAYLTPLPYPVEHNRLVVHGVYAIVRHPLYSSQIFAALAWSVFNLSISHGLVFLLAFLFFDYKAGREEQWLTERHPEYAAYAKRVSKFIPWLY